MLCKRLVAALAFVGALAAPVLAAGSAQAQEFGGHGEGGGHGGGHAGGVARSGHFAGPGGTWGAHPAWRGGGKFSEWHGGHWWHGTYGGRYGAWWIVGPDWYWYSTEVAPIPDPYTPAGMAPGYWYWCDAYQQYYPYVGACPTGWRAVAPH